MSVYHLFVFFFFTDTATTEIYTLSLHDALPISGRNAVVPSSWKLETSNTKTVFSVEFSTREIAGRPMFPPKIGRAHSELQSQSNLVCRLLLEKKKKKTTNKTKQHITQITRRDKI